MLSQDSLERAVRAAGIDVRPVFHQSTTSTNTEALALAEAGAPEWTVVAAGHQSAGRGRLGRTWASAPGKSLLFSVVLRPSLPPARAPLVSLLAAGQMAWAIAVASGVHEAATKWPNDLMVGERKVGGILAEVKVAGGRLEYVVLGIGLNLSMTEDELPPDPGHPATSLALEGVADPDAALLLTTFLDGFRATLRPDDPSFDRLAVTGFTRSCATIGRRVRATTVAGMTVAGAAASVNAQGGLVVIDAEGAEHTVAFGEVAHLDGEETP